MNLHSSFQTRRWRLIRTIRFTPARQRSCYHLWPSLSSAHRLSLNRSHRRDTRVRFRSQFTADVDGVDKES